MSDDKQAIIDLLDQYNHGTNTADAAALARLYTDDGVVMGGDMPTARGTEAVEGFYAYAFSMLRIEISFDIDPDAIEVFGDTAVATTRSSGIRRILGSEETLHEDNREMWVFARRGGSWKIARYMFNKTDEQQSRPASPEATTPNRQLLDRAMNALFRTRDEAAMRELYSPDYIQHNPAVPTGLDAVIGLLPVLEDLGTDYVVHRTVEDGPLLLTHTSYRNADVFGAPRVVAFDLWRIEDGKVAEHWDCITPAATESVSGHTQVGGTTWVDDRDRTEANKALVRGFVTDVLIGEDWSKSDRYVAKGRYIQHNPKVGSGMGALREAVDALKIERIHRVVGEGNFVLTQSEGTWDGAAFAFYDLFRLFDGKIVEHWDVLQPIPAEQAHDNTMF